MRTRWSTAMRNGVPVGIVKGMVAGAAGSTSGVRASSAEEGGAHMETIASSRGASSQAGTYSVGVGDGVPSAADWLSAGEAQSSNDNGRHQFEQDP
jgi:hypothetical protein